MHGNDNPYNPRENVIDIGEAAPSPEPQEDEMEYLTYLYDQDGTPMVEKLLVIHPFERVVKLEPRKSFFERLLDLFKT
jgi:hypothetical protein